MLQKPFVDHTAIQLNKQKVLQILMKAKLQVSL